MNLHGKKICDNCFAVIKSEPCPICGYKHSKYRPEIGVLPVGTVLAGHYAIGRVLGKGGFGVTYEAYDTRNDRVVAIKEYYPNGIAHRDTGTTGVSITDARQTETFKTGADKFFDEAKTVSKFNGNPNIVGVYEFFYENNTVYYVMEYLEGCDLKQYIKNNGGRLSEGKVLYVFNTLTDALVITHSLNVLHRDISPDNVFIKDNGEVKLIDFGAARQVIAEQSKSLSVILKQGFAPLEQYQRRGKQGPWTDIYALGATMYYALTGKVPEDATERIEDDSIGEASEYGVSDKLWKIIEKCLAVRTADRYKSVYELKADLANVETEPVPLVKVMEAEIPPTVMAENDNPDTLPGTVAVTPESFEEDILPGTIAVTPETSAEDAIPGTVAVEAEKNSDIPGTVAVSKTEPDEAPDNSGDNDKKAPIIAFFKSKKGIITAAGAAAAIVIAVIAVVLVSGSNRRSNRVSGNVSTGGTVYDYADGNTTGYADDESQSGERVTVKPTEKESGNITEKDTEDADGGSATDVTEPITAVSMTTSQAEDTTVPAPAPQAPAPTQAPAAPTQAPTEPSYVTERSCNVVCGSGNYSSASTLSGGKYTGGWKNGMPNGEGCYITYSANGNMNYYTIAKGTWKDGRMSGNGSYVSGGCLSSKGIPSVTTTNWYTYLSEDYDISEWVTIYKGTWADGCISGESTKYWVTHYKGTSYTLNGQVVQSPDRIEGNTKTTDWTQQSGGITDSIGAASWDYNLAL